MPYTYFHERIPAIALSETRSVLIRGAGGLPEGEYAFLEMYCDDPACDCHRVVLRVISRATGRRVLATISYGWESPEFYNTMLNNWEEAIESSEAILDPLNEQTEYSDSLLDLFLDIVLSDEYKERLIRHYRIFKADVRKNKRSTGRPKRKRRGR